MSCLNIALKGMKWDCNPNIAGIKRVWLGYYEDFTPTVAEATHSISELTAASGKKLYEYTFAKQTGGLTSTLTKDETKGVRYYTNEINLVFSKLEGAKHIEIEALAAEGLVALVETNEGTIWYVGADGYVSTTAADVTTGVAYDDQVGYTLTMSAMSAHLPYTIEKSVFESLIDTPTA